MTYKELLIKIAEHEDFDWQYTFKHMLVEECFNSELAHGKEWHDQADEESITEYKEALLK